jgi:hypothetical protein
MLALLSKSQYSSRGYACLSEVGLSQNCLSAIHPLDTVTQRVCSIRGQQLGNAEQARQIGLEAHNSRLLMRSEAREQCSEAGVVEHRAVLRREATLAIAQPLKESGVAISGRVESAW